MAAGLRKADGCLSICLMSALCRNTCCPQIVYSARRHTVLSPPAFEQCPVVSRVRADRPISAVSRTAHEIFVGQSMESCARDHARAGSCADAEEIAMIKCPDGMNVFEFAVLSGLRVAQLSRGCTPRLAPSLKLAVTAQREVAAGLVVQAPASRSDDAIIHEPPDRRQARAPVSVLAAVEGEVLPAMLAAQETPNLVI